MPGLCVCVCVCGLAGTFLANFLMQFVACALLVANRFEDFQHIKSAFYALLLN